MNIPLTPTPGGDVFDLGFDKSLNRAIPDAATGVVYDSINDTQNTASLLSGGSLNLKTLSVGGLVKQVAPGDDIQAAIDAVNREGGGTVQLLAKRYLLSSNIDIKSSVKLKGAGRDLTILDFGGTNYCVIINGSVSSVRQNMSVEDLSIYNSHASAGLDAFYSDFLQLNNLRVFSCSGSGIRIRGCQSFNIALCKTDSNTVNGIYILADAFRQTKSFAMLNCESSSNTGIGISIEQDSADVLVPNQLVDFQLINCRSSSNTSHGFSFTRGTAAVTIANSNIVGCRAISNSGNGFNLVNYGRIFFASCVATGNGVGFLISASTTISGSIVGCLSQTNVTSDYNIDVTSSSDVTFLGNTHTGDGNQTPHSQFVQGDNDIIESQYIGNSPRTRRSFFQMKNGSGSTITTGMPVVIKSDSAGDVMSTTSTNGDNKVIGMNVFQTADSIYGYVLREGYTTQLMVSNGTSSISIGDWLSTYSHAYYAKKAIAGDTAFAIALSTPTTSTAQISAVLFNPRLI